MSRGTPAPTAGLRTLVAGTWLEVAYDPLQGSVLPQRLLSREGAAIPLESVR